MSNEITPDGLRYQGLLGEVSQAGDYFFAWTPQMILVGTFKSFDVAIASLQKEAENPTR
jgi:hypothetical protein